MRIVHWRNAEHPNSSARKTVCGRYYDDVQTSHERERVTCCRCQRAPLDRAGKIYSLAELEAMDREETDFHPGALVKTALHYCRLAGSVNTLSERAP